MPFFLQRQDNRNRRLFGEEGARPMSDKDKHEKQQVAMAWAVHALTASGVVLGFLALVAIFNNDKTAVFLWLGLALFVDGIDGTLARKLHVRDLTPQVDGTTLDNVIDYFNYVAVPAMMVYWFGFVPEGWATIAAATIMAVSCYTFANTNIKTSDLYFSGFPALWNLVVLYFHIMQTGPWTNLIAIGAFSVLTFVPIKFVHPFRVLDWRNITVPMTVLWAATTLRLVLIPPEGSKIPSASSAIFWLWIMASVYFLALSLWRSLRPDPEPESE
jgi:phosphatidylcholine synthase